MIELPTRKTENWKYSVPPAVIAEVIEQQPATHPDVKPLPSEAQPVIEKILQSVDYSKHEQHPFLQQAIERGIGEYRHVAENDMDDKRFTCGISDHPPEHWLSYVYVFNVDPGVKAEYEINFYNDELFSNMVVLVNLSEGAELTLYCGDYSYNTIAHVVVEQATNSRFNCWHYVADHDLGGEAQGERKADLYARTDIQVRLRGEGASCHLNGLTDIRGTTQGDNHLRVDHMAPNTRSEQLYKYVLDGKSHGVFNGKAVIHPNCPGSVAMQHNHNLLLSAGAAIDTKPELEIYTDDVECAHGATVGQLDENALFYCQSRGIPLASARQLLLHAFKEEVFSAADNQAILMEWGA